MKVASIFFYIPMSELCYIEVILPLKLDFNPLYVSEKPLTLGQRLYVNFAGRNHLAVVSKVHDKCPVVDFAVRPVGYIPASLSNITSYELKFWNTLSEYYMCPVGLIYKMAYPESRVDSEMNRHKEAQGAAEVTVRDFPLSPNQKSALDALKSTTKITLLSGDSLSGKSYTAAALALDYLKAGKNVLVLKPNAVASRKFAALLTEYAPEAVLCLNSTSKVAQRSASEIIQKGESNYIMVGTSAALFMPFQSLDLVIVDDENDTNYKVNQSPRFNARDAALFLATIYKAKSVLVSSTPTLGVYYNVQAGRYSEVKLEGFYSRAIVPELEIVDLFSEKKLGGLEEKVSRKLFAAISSTLSSQRQAIIIRYRSGQWEEEIDNVLNENFKDANIVSVASDMPVKEQNAIFKQFKAGIIDILIGGPALEKCMDNEEVGLVALLSADSMLMASDDYSSDEVAVQKIKSMLGKCQRSFKKATFLIQTYQKRSLYIKNLQNTQALYAELLNQRHEYSYPPYSRVVELIVSDTNAARGSKLSQILREDILLEVGSQCHRIAPLLPMEDHWRFKMFLKRDNTLIKVKSLILNKIKTFEEKYSYKGHILIDVD